MAGVSELSIDTASRDFVINGRQFLTHLAQHELIDPSSYQPALGCQPEAKARLLGAAEPDLVDDHVALYVCGWCGDYDGSPIGARVVFDQEEVRWEDLGWHDDFRGWQPFRKVREYRFRRATYMSVVRSIAEDWSA
jgi:hypothetical protein